MKKYLIHHSVQYLLIFLVFITAVASLFVLGAGPGKIVTVYSLALLYLLWGTLHHYYEHDLTWEVVVEYLIFATLILWVLMSVI